MRTNHSTDGTDPRWSAFTKRTVALILFLLLALVIYRFRDLVAPLMIAFLTAFILHPIVSFLKDHLPISRGAATAVIFLVLILAMLATLAAPVAVVPSIQRAVRSFQFDFNRVITDIGDFLDQPVEFAGYTLDLSRVYEEISSMLRSFVTRVAQGTVDVAFSVASGALWMLFILMTAFYLVKDADRLIRQIDDLAPPGYQEDMARLRQRVTRVWNAFLRGQLILGLAMVVITTVIGTAIGLPYAVVMGVIAGLMEFVPNVGPIIALIPAVLVALFQGSSFLPMSNFWFAVLVLGVYIVIQQIEGNLLVPRILGSSLNLHPLVVLIGIIIGGNLAGILGMLLAAPVLATLRVIGYYIFCRLYDRDPFAPPPKAQPAPAKPGLVQRTCEAAWYQLQERLQEEIAYNRRLSGTQGVHVEAEIRKARPEDKAAVEAICAQIWEGDDYVPQVWDQWLNDLHGTLVVAEVDEHVVGLGKLTRLDEDEWWLEGLRVTSAQRERGIGGLLHAHLVEKAHQMGYGTLRLGTHAENTPVHRLARRTGFERVAVYRPYRAAPLPTDETPSLRRLTEEDLPQAWTLIKDSPRYRAADGLYETFWSWEDLTEERLAQHITSGNVRGLDVQGKLAALALLAPALAVPMDDPLKLFIGYVDGRAETLSTLLRGLRGLAAQLDVLEIRFRPVVEHDLLQALEEVGYEPREKNDLWIFEKGLAKMPEVHEEQKVQTTETTQEEDAVDVKGAKESAQEMAKESVEVAKAQATPER